MCGVEGTELGPGTIKLNRSQCSARGLAGSRWLVVTVYYEESKGQGGKVGDRVTPKG